MKTINLPIASTATGLRFRSHCDHLEVAPNPSLATGLPLHPLCTIAGSQMIGALASCLYSLSVGSDADPTLIANLGDGAEIYCAITGGNRAIVMTSQGALHILLTGGEAVCLGSLPSLPPISLSLDAATHLVETIPAVAVADAAAIRSGRLGEADSEALRKAFSEAWTRIVARAETLGMAVIPDGATLTAEVRSLDSAGKAIGSRGRVAVGPGASPAEMKSMLSADAVGPFELSVPVFNVAVGVADLDPEEAAVWGSGATKAEIALSAASPVAVSWGFRVERPALGEPVVTVFPRLTALSSPLDAPLQSVAIIDVGRAARCEVTIPTSVATPVVAVDQPAGLIARVGAISGDVVMWGCLDGAPGDVVVASAASPLAVTSRATVSMSPIVRLVAVPRLGSVALSPGCAHFYAFTPDGTLNVSVSVKRGVPAASLLDRRAVSFARQVAVMADKVVVLPDGGRELLLLRGGRAQLLYRFDGDISFCAIAPAPGRDDVWLLAPDGSISVLDTERLWLTCRQIPADTIASMTASGERLYLTGASGLLDVGRPDLLTPVSVAWSGSISLPEPLLLRRLTLGLDAPGGFTGSLKVWLQGFSQAVEPPVKPLWAAHIDGTPRSPIAFPLALPVRSAARIRLEGRAAPLSRLSSIKIAYAQLSR